MGSVGQRAAKLLAVNVGGLKKVCHAAPAALEPVGPSATPTGFESFSKFDRQQLCSPLTFHPWAGEDLSLKIDECDQTIWNCITKL